MNQQKKNFSFLIIAAIMSCIMMKPIWASVDCSLYAPKQGTEKKAKYLYSYILQYQLQHDSFFPNNLQELINSGIANDEDIKDCFGGTFCYRYSGSDVVVLGSHGGDQGFMCWKNGVRESSATCGMTACPVDGGPGSGTRQVKH